MKKLLLLGFLSMFVGTQAHAGFISIVNGADMAGIEVTATFSNSTTETIVWEAQSADSGGVSGTDWSLSQVGDSFGELGPLGVVGAWTIFKGNSDLVSLFINLLPASFVFDTAYGDASANGSGNGREFVPATPIGYAFSGLVQDELYTGLTLDNISDGETQFVIDTDLVSASAPSTVSILLLSLLGLVMSSRRKQA
ncbi:hypothetical protein [Paraglaciecola arctica]|uniref:hypothetical protein n=1 Tax=Paraglaciecola arctica TaxID=1128911 RepID=UPI001C0725C0|nr:hypothetical protein [Paraglaciecola arctica]MBU3004325.1 hypothetical protein [Paraglaciecola arctica]